MSERASEYQVGYRKPPRHTRFRNGQSGNPRGRPQASESFVRLARRVLNEKIVIRENGQRRKITKFEAALKQLANKAAAGDPRAIRDVLKLQPLLGQPEHANDEKIIVNIVRFADQGPTASGRE